MFLSLLTQSHLFLFLLINLVHPFSNGLVIPWVQSTWFVWDLFSTEQVSFSASAKYCTINGIYSPEQPKTNLCSGFYYMGGLNVLKVGDYIERIYDSLPSHDMISYYIRFLIIDDWQPSDKIIISFSGTSHTFSEAPYLMGPADSANITSCGDPTYRDENLFVVVGKFFHNVSSLTVRITSNIGTNLKSYGIRGVRFTFREKLTTDSENACVRLSYPELSPSLLGKCSCSTQEYLNQTTNSCQSCDASCLQCYGPTAKECYSCKDNYSFDGESCIPCSPGCRLCFGPNSNQCNFCAAPNSSNWDYTCQANCNLPYTKEMLGTFSICTKTPCQVNGTFMAVNGTCLSACPMPYRLRIEGMVNFCDRPCSNSLEYYYLNDSQCRSGCANPHTKIYDVFCLINVIPPNNTTNNTTNSTTTLPSKESVENSSEIKTFTGIMNVTGNIIKFIGSTVSLINFDNPAAFFLGTLTDMLKYIRYIEVNYPPKLEAILDTEVESPTIIPGIPDRILNNLPNYPLPWKFDQYETHSSFLVNFWDSLLILIFLTVSICMICVFECLSRSCQLVHKFCLKLKEALKWNFFLGYSTSLFGAVVLYTSFELRTAELNTFLPILSLTICMTINLIVLIVFLRMVQVIFILQKGSKELNRNSNANYKYLLWKKFKEYGIIFESYKHETFAKQAFMCIFVARAYFFYATIAYLCSYPLIQISIITALCLIMTLYLVLVRPFKKNLDLAQNIFQEVVLLLTNACVTVLSLFDKMDIQNSEARRILGDVIIYLNLSFSVVGVIFLMIQIFYIIKNGIIEIINKMKIKNSSLAGVNCTAEHQSPVVPRTQQIEIRLQNESPDSRLFVNLKPKGVVKHDNLSRNKKRLKFQLLTHGHDQINDKQKKVKQQEKRHNSDNYNSEIRRSIFQPAKSQFESDIELKERQDFVDKTKQNQNVTKFKFKSSKLPPINKNKSSKTRK